MHGPFDLLHHRQFVRVLDHVQKVGVAVLVATTERLTKILARYRH